MAKISSSNGFTVEDGIPIPGWRGRTGGFASTVRQLAIGQSILVGGRPRNISAQAAASTRTEMEVRAQLLKECDQIVRDTLAEPDENFAILGRNPTLADAYALEQEKTATRAQSAFLEVVKTASEMTTERLLFEARSVAHDLTERDDLSRMEYDERLIAECKRLTKGDELKARILASAVLFGE